jgi:chromosome segregation ATPase
LSIKYLTNKLTSALIQTSIHDYTSCLYLIIDILYYYYTPADLESFGNRLKVGRDELHRLETDMKLSTRKLEIVRTDVRDTSTLSEVEHRNFSTVRERVQEVRADLLLVEADFMAKKEAVLLEESKLRQVKSLTNEQLRMLQGDVDRLQSEFKLKQQALEGVDRQRSILEEEIESRKREAEAQGQMISRNIEQESRKLHQLQSDLHSTRIDWEQVTKKKRLVDTEISVAAAELERMKSDVKDRKKRVGDLEQQVDKLEQRLNRGKESLVAVENEKVQVKRECEELKRSRPEVERSIETRKKAAEEEMTQVRLYNVLICTYISGVAFLLVMHAYYIQS